MGHRRRKRRSKENELSVSEKNGKFKGSKLSISELLKKTDLKEISGQLRGAADSLEKIGEIALLLQQVDILVKPTDGSQNGGSFNIMKLLQNGNSLNHLIQVILPILNQTSDEKVSPITVETVDAEEQKQ